MTEPTPIVTRFAPQIDTLIAAVDDLRSLGGRGENERDSEGREPEHQRPNATCGTARSASAASK